MLSPAYIYAKSLWNWAQSQKQEQQWGLSLHKLTTLMKKWPSMGKHEWGLFQKAIIKDWERFSLKKSGFDRWLALLIQNHKLSLIPEIEQYYDKWLKAREHISLARVEIPHSISDAQKVLIQNVIQKKWNSHIECVFIRKENLVGGFRVWINSELWDVSFQGWSERLLNKIERKYVS